MGRLFKRKRIEEAKVSYVLKRQNPDGRGMTKVCDLAGPVSIDELYPHLEPGIYALHKYTEGKSGFEVVWGPVEVVGEEPAKRERTEKHKISPISGIVDAVQYLKDFKDDLNLLYNTLKDVVGETSEDKLINELGKLREKYEKLDNIFGSKAKGTGGTTIPVEGKIPAWMVFMPNLTDDVMDNIERRLARWGLIEAKPVPEKSGKFSLELPPKPKTEGEKGESAGK